MTSNQFAMSFPALNGEYVLQGHVDYCAANGHATHTTVDENGNVTATAERCPRCGDLLRIETSAPADAEAVIKAAFVDCLEVGSKLDGRTVVEFRTAENAAERAAMLAPVVASVEICPNPTWIVFRRTAPAVMHEYNPNEGSGQSHTYCGATMTPEVYRELLNRTNPKTCPSCSRAASDADEYAAAYDL